MALCLSVMLCCGRDRPPNVVLIVLDTVRADFLAVSEENRTSSLLPSLDRISDEGLTFTKARSAAPWTVPSHASIFTGLYPHSHGAVHEAFHLGTGVNTIAEELRSHGYATVGVNCNPWLHRQSGFAQGFDVYEDIYREVEEEDDKGAALATGKASEWLVRLADGGKPFFMFINYLEAHLPFAPPPRVIERMTSAGYEFSFERFPVEEAEAFIAGERKLSQEELRTVENLYLAEIAYLDDRIGELYALLDRLNLLDATVLIITSDHGEHLGDHHLMGHEFSVYEPLLRVPLVIRYPPAFPPGGKQGTPVSLVDLFPTIEDLAGIPDERSAGGPGRSLLPASGDDSGSLDDRTIMSEYSRPSTLIGRYWRSRYPDTDLSRYEQSLRALVRGSYKYIETGRGRELLFDIARDPAEMEDLSASRPETLQEMRNLIEDVD